MKALVYTSPGTLEFREEPKPIPKQGELLVRVAACGICGSDMHGYHGLDSRRAPPLVLGHEAAGTIEGGARDGQRVTINPLVTCGECVDCIGGRPQICAKRENISLPPRQGAFAEWVCVPEENLSIVPDSMSFETAALVEPIAVSYHASELARRYLFKPLAEAKYLILGGGAIGLATALVLKARGATDIALGETNSVRRQIVLEAGIHDVFDPAQTSPADDNYDVVIDAVGASVTRETSSRVVRRGGVIVHIGLIPGSDGLDVRRITLQEIVFTGSYCYTPNDFQATLELLAEGRLGNLNWMRTRSMAEGPAVFKELDTGLARAAKFVLVNS